MPYYIKRKSSLKSKSTSNKSKWVRKLDQVFSQYIRLRDALPYRGVAFKCVSCGAVKPIAEADCGHYYSRTKMSTRWDEDNCHAECRYCNRFSSDHLDGYHRTLVALLGEQGLAELRVRSCATRTWSVCELQRLTAHYKEEVKRLQAIIDKGEYGSQTC